MNKELWDECYKLSHSWFVDLDGARRFLFRDIPLGLLAQVYLYQKLVGNGFGKSKNGSIAFLAKQKGFDWQLKFLYGLYDRVQYSDEIPNGDGLVIYDVRNQPIVRAMNLVAGALIKLGNKPIGLLSDPGMRRLADIKVPSISYSVRYGIKEERDARQAWRVIRAELDVLSPHLLQRFSRFLRGDKTRAHEIVTYLYRFFCQSIRDVVAIDRVTDDIKPDYTVSGSDSHKVSRIIALMGKSKGWKSVVVQHGAPVLPYAYVPVYADKVALWGNESYDWFKSHGTPEHKLIITGNPRFDEFSERRKRVVRVVKKVVLLTNPTGENVNRKILETVLAALEQFDDVLLEIKVHPSESKDQYSKLTRRTSIPLRISSGCLHDVISPGDIVICVNSTAGIEALMLGAFLIILKIDGVPDTIPYHKYCAAVEVRTTAELEREVRTIQRGQGSVREESVGEFLTSYVGALDGKASERIAKLVVAKQQKL